MTSALALLLVTTVAIPARTEDDWSRSAEAGRLARMTSMFPKAIVLPEPFIVAKFVQPIFQTPEKRAAAILRLEKKCSDAGSGFHVIGKRLELLDSWRMAVIFLVQMCAPAGQIISDGRTRALMFAETRSVFPHKGLAKKHAGDALVRQCSSKAPGASLLRDEYKALAAGVVGGIAYAVGICRY